MCELLPLPVHGPVFQIQWDLNPPKEIHIVLELLLHSFLLPPWLPQSPTVLGGSHPPRPKPAQTTCSPSNSTHTNPWENHPRRSFWMSSSQNHEHYHNSVTLWKRLGHSDACNDHKNCLFFRVLQRLHEINKTQAMTVKGWFLWPKQKKDN